MQHNCQKCGILAWILANAVCILKLNSFQYSSSAAGLHLLQLLVEKMLGISDINIFLQENEAKKYSIKSCFLSGNANKYVYCLTL